MNPHEVGLTWRWDVSDALHVGSGLSRAGYADLLIARDARGIPVVPGDAVRGALRMAAEEIVAWLTGRPELYDAVAHPRNPVLKALFGPEASHFSPIYPDGKSGGMAADMLAESTAVDRGSGSARDDTLRVAELLAPGASLQGDAVFFNTRFLDEPVITLLCAALLGVESIGGGAGRGWGRLRIRPDSVHLSTGTSIAEHVTEDRLSLLKRALLAGPDAVQERFINGEALAGNCQGETIERGQEERWWKLSLTLREPTCIGKASDIGNRLSTQEWISGTALRGALQAVWRRCGLGHSDLQGLLDSNSRWTPAWIAREEQPARITDGPDDQERLPGLAQPAAPAPLSWLREKHAEGLDGPHGVHDLLAPTSPERKRCCELAAASGALQWKASGRLWLDRAAPRPAAQAVQRELGMHVARDYVTGSKRKGALWARESISPSSPDGEQTRFVAYARVPIGEDDWPQRVYLGRRVSAGGAADLEATPEEPWFLDGSGGVPDEEDACASRDVFVQLLAPAIVRDPVGGHWLRGLSPDAWPDLAGVEVELEAVGFGEGEAAGSAAFVANHLQGSWMGQWGHARAPTPCIDTGSAWRLRCRTVPKARVLSSALRRLAREGIGERRHEGFGWFAVNPHWLGHHVGHPCEGAAMEVEAPSSSNRRKAWPGVAAVTEAEVDRLAAAVNALCGEAISASLAAPLQELLTHARVGRQPESILEICERRGRRTRRSIDGSIENQSERLRWKPLLAGGRVRALLERERGLDREAFLFLLHALLVRCRGESASP